MVGRYTIGSNEVQCEVLYAVGRCCVILSGRCVMLGKAGEALECGSWRPGAVPGARLPCYRGTGGRCPGAALLLLHLLALLLRPGLAHLVQHRVALQGGDSEALLQL